MADSQLSPATAGADVDTRALNLIHRQQLANGALMLVKERPTSGVVAISVAIRSGSRDEAPNEHGSRNLLARAHLLGTERWPTEDALRRAVANTGGGIGASTSAELTAFSVTVPFEELDLALAVLADVLNSPRFDPEPMERDRKLVLQDILRRQSDPAPLGFDTLVDTVWRGHPGGHTSLGTAETVSTLARDALLAIRERTIVGRNITVALVGQVDRDLAFAGLAGAVGSLPAGEATPRALQAVPPPVDTETVSLQAGQRQAIVIAGVPTAGRLDPDRYPLLAIDTVLGSPAGRLFGEIRTNRGLAYVAGSGVSFLSDTGLFYANAGTDPANIDEVLRLINQELRRLIDEPVPSDRLAAAVSGLAGRRIMAEETSASQAGQIAALTALGSYESAEQFQEAIRRVTADDIQRAAARYFGAGQVRILVRPKESA